MQRIGMFIEESTEQRTGVVYVRHCVVMIKMFVLLKFEIPFLRSVRASSARLNKSK
jgi:hypothetical protein